MNNQQDSTVKIDRAMVEGFYLHHLNRDLINLLAGGLFIEIIWYSLNGQLLDFPISWEHSFKLIGFIAVSYLVGFMFDGIGDLVIHYVAPLTERLPNGFESSLVLRHHLIVKGKCDQRIIDQLERYVSLWIAGKSIGLSILFGSVIMILTRYFHIDVNLIIFLCPFLGILLGIFMLKKGREAGIQHIDELSHLNNYIQMNEPANQEKRNQKLEKSE